MGQLDADLLGAFDDGGGRRGAGDLAVRCAGDTPARSSAGALISIE